MNHNYGIQAVGAYLSSEAQYNIQKFPNLYDENYLINTVGIEKTYHKKKSETAVDLCHEAFMNLSLKQSFDIQDVDVIVLVSQHTRPNIPPLSAILAGKINAKSNTFVLDISNGCTGFVQGMYVIMSLLKSLCAKSGLLFNVETLSDVLSSEDPNTNFIFSDAATATLFTHKDFIIEPVDYNFGTSGEFCMALNSLEGKLEMDGLKIYDFVTRNVPGKLVDFFKNDIDAIYFHQASLRTVSKLKQMLARDDIFIPFSILDYGNTGSCSVPILLNDNWGRFDSQQKPYLILSSFGSGLSYANALMRLVSK